MDILVVKALSGLLLWVLSLIFGLLIPYLLWKSRANCQKSSQNQQQQESGDLLSRQQNQSNYHCISNQEPCREKLESVKNRFKEFRDDILKYDLTSFINCLCGGLFLGICLLELLPEARESVQSILTDLNVRTSLPITEFFVTIGLLLVMLIEQTVNSIYLCHRAAKSRDYKSISETTSACNSRSRSSDENDVDNRSNQREEMEFYNVKCEDGEPTSATEATRSVVLIALLSVHSVFEGLALGLEATVSYVIQLLVAISVHKSLISFSLGIKLFETFTPNKVNIAVICALIFCTASPLGCAIGILMTLGNEDSNWHPSDVIMNEPNLTSQLTTAATTQVTATAYAAAIMECLATGTFLYVTFIEVIPLEFAHANDDHVVESTDHQKPSRRPRKKPIGSYLKLSALALGFATVTGLQFI